MLKKTRSFVRHILLMTMAGIMTALYGISAYAAESGFEVPAVDSRTLTVQAADPHAYLMAFLTAYAGFIALIVIVALLFQCIARMFLFKKAGVPGWKAWIPFYSDYTLFKLTSGIGWLFLVPLLGMCIPLVGPIVVILARVFLAAAVVYAYGSGWPFAVLYFVVPPVAELILGVNKSPYVGPEFLRQRLHL